MQNFCLSEAIRERYKEAENALGYSEHVMKLHADDIDVWEYRDRKGFEMGNIESLGFNIRHHGQCQPIVVVRTSATFKPKENSSAQYVVILGYRRWLACKQYHMDVDAVVKNMTLNQALSMLISENEKTSVSDYSKGILYDALLSTGTVNEEQLSKGLGINAQALHHYLSFAAVPEEIWNAIGNLSQVSAKTASTIESLANKGPEYVDALVALGSKIAHGYGEKRIQRSVDDFIDKGLAKEGREHLEHQIKFKGKAIMSLNQDKIRLDKSLVGNEHYGDLIKKIEKDITDFAQLYLT